MKRNPTLSEKKQLRALGMSPADWLVRKNCAEGMTVEHKHTGQKKIIPRALMKE